MKRIDAFWDSSALVPLCVDQGSSNLAQAAMKNKFLAVWWGTPVEMMSAFARLLRSGDLDPEGFELAVRRLARLRRRWVEVQPTAALRLLAENLLQQHSLRAADALQLAAALIWAKRQPQKRVFLCFDGRLAEAARKENFFVEAP